MRSARPRRARPSSPPVGRCEMWGKQAMMRGNEALAVAGVPAAALQEWPASGALIQGVMVGDWIILGGRSGPGYARRGVPVVALRRAAWRKMRHIVRGMHSRSFILRLLLGADCMVSWCSAHGSKRIVLLGEGGTTEMQFLWDHSLRAGSAEDMGCSPSTSL